MINSLEVTNLAVDYGNKRVLKAINLRLRTGELGCLLGVTGSGKTALLRTIAGFVRPSKGQIRIGEQLMASDEHFIPPERRYTGLVFQDYNLFPHLCIAENIGYGLTRQSRVTARVRVEKLLDLARLSHKADAYPHQLSGGERQRAALARAMAPSPRLILLDEPFASQDSNLRETLAHEVKDMLKTEQITALMVTHDQTEAFALADKLGVLREGRIEQWDEPYNIYHHPANRAIAEFVGLGAMLSGVIVNPTTVNTALGQIRLPVDMNRFRARQQVQVFVRPEDIVHTSASRRKAEVLEAMFRGPTTLYRLRSEQSFEEFYAITPSFIRYRPGERFGLTLAMEELVMFEENHAHPGSGDIKYEHAEGPQVY